MQTCIQPGIRQLQRMTESNGIGGAVNTVDSTLVTLIRNAENANKIFKEQTPKIFYVTRATKYQSPIAGY